MTEISRTLSESGSRYGDFTDHARIADHLLEIMQAQPNWVSMLSIQRQALRVISDKIARMLNGDPLYDDNWRDIAGYATLVLDRLSPFQTPDKGHSHD